MEKVPLTPEQARAMQEQARQKMLSAEVRAYALAEPAWHGAFVEFPLNVPRAYASTGYWSAFVKGAGAQPDVRITAAPASEASLLRERAGLQDPGAPDASHSLCFAGRTKTIEAGLRRHESGAASALIEDGDTAVLLVATGRVSLPATLKVEAVGPIDSLIDGWINL
ncbi:hypothetical protein ACIPY5_19735 [Microbacterium sp. NPDC089698]|uniref:hypothetical protein n=1 Tax=Microbacterium sp. NPDC089698 TaxID=3364200 RepID=UPI003823B541